MSEKMMGVGLLVGAGVLAYKIWDSFGSIPKVKKIPRETIIQILKEIKGQLFTLLFTIPDLKASLEAELLRKNKENTSDPERIKLLAREIIYPDIIQIIQRKEALIYTKHNQTEEDVKQNLEHIYNKDKQIIALRQSIYDALEDALNGKPPSLNIKDDILQYLDKTKCLAIVRKILIDAGKRFQDLFTELREKDKIEDLSFKNPKVVRRLHDLKLGDVKRDLLRKEGLGQFDDSPTEILGKVSQKYRKSDPEFNKGLELLEKKHEEVMDKLGENPLRGPTFVDDIYGEA
jgi:predicted metal-dependent hydrolase